MKRWGAGRLLAMVTASVLLWAVVAAGCVCLGSTGAIGLPFDPSGSLDFFVLHYRIEIVLIASLVGAALGAAGVVYQAILRNPLADPYLLGVSSGASLLSLLWYVGALATLAVPLQAVGQQAFAFAGALASIAIVFLIASRRGRIEPVTLILVGVIMNAVNGSIYLLIFFRHPELISRGEFTFLVGGIQTNLTSEQEWLAAACVAVGWIVLFYFTGQLNAAPLGEVKAQALGVRIHRLRWIGLVVASVITASVVAISGPIGFVGLVCPHLARLVVGRDQRRLLPVATALAAALLAVADAASRYISRASLLHTQMPVGVLTGLLGGPFFLLLLWQSRRQSQETLCSLLEARNLAFSYGVREVLRDVSLSISSGEVIALLGPNGTGKSTLLRVLIGQLRSSGQVLWNGRDVRSWPRQELARTVAYLPQSPAADPEQRVVDVLRTGRTPYWGPFGIESAKDVETVERIASQIGLTEFLSRPIGELSGGQRQLVFLGRCLVQEPAALLLDEPNTFLDLRHQAELAQLLKRLSHDAGLAILMTCHDLAFASALVDRIVLLSDGKVVTDGPPAHALDSALFSRVFGVPIERIELDGGRTPVLFPRIS